MQKAKAIAVTFLALVMVLGLSVPLAASRSAVTVAVDAPLEVPAGTHFSAPIAISDVLDFDAGNYDVTFDHALLEVTGVSGGDIGGTPVPVDIWTTVAPGTIRVIQNIPGFGGASGPGHLAVVHFYARSPGEPAVVLSNGILGNASAEQIPAVWTGDTMSVLDPGPVTVSVEAPDTAPVGSDFTANIAVSNVLEFDASNYDISFDPSLLEVTNVTAGDIAGTPVPADVWALVAPGRIRVIQNIPGFSGISGPGYLAVVHFHALAPGPANIALSNGILGNAHADSIPALWVGDSVTLFAGENSPPSAPVVDLTPNAPLTGDNLVSTVTTPSTDPEGGTVTYTYEWYRDQGGGFVLQPGLTTSTTALSASISSASTAKGDVWRSVVTPSDGVLTGPSAQDQVTVGGGVVSLTTDFLAGWNMWSFPLEPDPATWAGQLADDILPLYVYWYDPTPPAGYDMESVLSITTRSPFVPSVGMGYWTKVYDVTTVDVEGFAVPETEYRIHVLPGWNMIGTPRQYPVNWGDVQVDMGGTVVDILTSHGNNWVLKYIYWYDPTPPAGYEIAEAPAGQLMPFAGYWVKSFVEADLIIPASGP